jgi:hypothetical protein
MSSLEAVQAIVKKLQDAKVDSDFVRLRVAAVVDPLKSLPAEPQGSSGRA